MTRTGEILWRDDAGCLHRLTYRDDALAIFPAPYAVARASRVISTSSGLWVIGDTGESLLRYEEDTLTRLSVVNLHTRVVDIASDRLDALFALVEGLARRRQSGSTVPARPSAR
ncbi:MAG: hypothetical protein U1E63_15925 [Burkholderiales bacterium]